MAEKAPERKVETSKNPKEVAAEQQKDLKGSVEAETTLAKKDYKVGEKGLTQEQRAKLTPAQREKYPRVEKGKKYIAIGGVDKVPFKPVVRDNLWYLEMARVGDLLLKNQNSVTFEFPAMRKDPKYKERILGAVRDIANGAMLGVTNDIQPDEFKKKIESGREPSDIYGSEGAFNVILAYGRAIDLLNNVEPGASIDYRLRLSGKRYSQLLAAKKQKESQKSPVQAPSVSPLQKLIKQKSLETGKKEFNIFNSQMEDFFKDREALLARITACRDKAQMSPEVASKLGSALYALDFHSISSKNPSDEDYVRLEFNERTLNDVRAKIEAAEKIKVPTFAEKVMGGGPAADLPRSSTGVDVPNAGYNAPAEDYVDREKREQAEAVIKEGNLEKNYTWNEDKLDEMVAMIAHDVVEAVSPAVTDTRLYEKLIQPLVLASLRNLLNERHAARANGESVPSHYRMSEAEKVRYITVVLSQMKTTSTIRSKKVN